jgi:hypothetical protein
MRVSGGVVGFLVAAALIVTACSSDDEEARLPDPVVDGGFLAKDGGGGSGAVAVTCDVVEGVAPAQIKDPAAIAPPADYTPVSCQPDGEYQLTGKNVGPCVDSQQVDLVAMDKRSATFDNRWGFPSTTPYNLFYNCDPPIPTFAEGTCSVVIPTGTQCRFPGLPDPLEVTACSTFACTTTASKCTWDLFLRFNVGTPSECDVHQVYSMSR